MSLQIAIANFGKFHPGSQNHVIPQEVVVNNFEEIPSRVARTSC